MRKENTDLSRRNFLTKGGAALAAASIIVIPGAGSGKVQAETVQMLSNDPVYTEDPQTLIKKTISSRSNTLGTDYINVREYLVSGTDITQPLQDAINSLYFTDLKDGGRILIPKGVWTTKGGHFLPDGVSIEGVGVHGNLDWGGTELVLSTESGSSDHMFKILAERRHVTIKNMMINLMSRPDAIGIWMTNYQSAGRYIYNTHIENVAIHGGAFGIKVDDPTGSDFECILNRFERITFFGCTTAFSCNTINSGFTFDNCHFQIPPANANPSRPAGVALDCKLVGNIALDHCLFVGIAQYGANMPVLDGTTILKMETRFNNISFYDCQDEGLQYAYQNVNNPYDYVPIVYRNCLIQSHFKFNIAGAVTLDSCRCSGTVYDTVGNTNGYALVYLKGLNNFYTQTSPNADLSTALQHPKSKIIREKLDEGKPAINPIAVTGQYQSIPNKRGTVNIAAGESWVQVFNPLVTADTLLFAQLRTYDSGGAKIREISHWNGYFVIYLTQAAATTLSIGFVIESY